MDGDICLVWRKRVTGNKKLSYLNWKEFIIKELFSIKRGKRLKGNDHKVGNIAYYSATEYNNGLTDFIDNPLFIEKNKILSTTFGDLYYVSGDFTASDEITILGNKRLNKYVGSFLSTILKNNKRKFAFGYKAFTKRTEKQIIILPSDKNGQPDWEFMEQYMKNIEQKLMKRCQKYFIKSKDTERERIIR
jgi:hypothetical protein